MITELRPADEAGVRLGAECIRAGELVAFPTETVYGLGANALDGEAVLKIFAAKGRPADNPLIAHIAELGQIRELITGELSPLARKLAAAFWPGPLTMLFPRAEAVPDVLTAGLPTVAVRFPSHPAAQRLIAAAGVPIAAPSANRSGRPSPTTAAHVLEDMEGRIPLILDGGPCAVGLESTVLDVASDPPRILRPGGVTPEMIRAAVGGVLVDETALKPLAPGEKPRSPGMKYRHYAPKGMLTIVRGEPEAVARRICRLYDEAEGQGKRAAILSVGSHAADFGARSTRALGQRREAGEVAAQLFAALREMDELGVEVIFSEAVAAEGIGLAVMNRLGRAAAFQTIDA